MSRKLSVNAPCPCGSGAKLKRCCARWHKTRKAPSPEALMRSRYTAYALGDADYIVATSHPELPVPDRASVERFCTDTEFLGLRVEHASSEGDRGEVRFHATLRQGGRDASFTEHSRFERVDGRWLYRGRV